MAYIGLCSVALIPVVAPKFLHFPMPRTVLPEQMKAYVQCIIRDSATHSAPRDFYVLKGARSLTVSDQLMKKELIVQGMAWGHLPDYLVADELRSGTLQRLKGKYFLGGAIDLVAARLIDKPHGPVAERLWQHIDAQAPWRQLTN